MTEGCHRRRRISLTCSNSEGQRWLAWSKTQIAFCSQSPSLEFVQLPTTTKHKTGVVHMPHAAPSTMAVCQR